MLKYYLFINIFFLNWINTATAQQHDNTIIIGELAGRVEYDNIHEFIKKQYSPLFRNHKLHNIQIVKKSPDEIILRYNTQQSSQLQNIIIRFYDSEKALMIAIIIDEVDFAITESAKIAEDIQKSNPAIRILFQYKPLNFVKMIAYNNKYSLFRNVNVRHALSYAINKQKILTTILNNQADITSAPIDKKSKSYSKEFKEINYDPKQALILLHNQGWYDNDNDGILENKDQRFSFTLIYEKGNLLDEQIVRMVKIDLNKIGIDVAIKPLKTEDINKKLKTKSYQALLTNLQSEDNIDFLRRIWGGRSAGNFCNYKKRSVDRYLALFHKADSKTREQLLQGVINIVIQDQPGTFLFFLWLDWYFVNNSKFDNFWDNSGRLRPLNEWIIKN